MEYRKVLLTLKESDHKKLKILAIEQNKTMSFIVQQSLREFMLKHEDNKDK